MDTLTKKGKSRAKCFISCSSTSSDDRPSTSKRTKIDGQERQLKINDILEKIADTDGRITYKQCRIDTAAATKNFKTSDELSQEISELKSQKSELNYELVTLQKMAVKSAWYHKSKPKAQSTDISGSDASDVSAVDNSSRENSVEFNSVDQPFWSRVSLRNNNSAEANKRPCKYI